MTRIAEIRALMASKYEEMAVNPVKIVVSEVIYDDVEVEFGDEFRELQIDGVVVRWAPEETGIRLEYA